MIVEVNHSIWIGPQWVARLTYKRFNIGAYLKLVSNP